MIILLSILLLLSLSLNILFLWYVKKMLKELLFTSDNIVQLEVSMGDFASHVEGIYGQETYYGDPTIEGLIKHSKELVEEIKDFQDIYSSRRDEARAELLDKEEDGEEN